MGYIYSTTKRERDPHALPDVEVWYEDDAESGREPGWYWAPGFPGCLWDSEPEGPYATEDEAVLAVLEEATWDDESDQR
jgi:hypothetical protein